MKVLMIYTFALVSMLAIIVLIGKSPVATVCWCWPPTRSAGRIQAKAVSQEFAPIGSYGTEADWSNADRIIQLNYSQDQGKRLFYQYCVWCHADSTPAGPSNRSNVTPEPPLLNDPTLFKGKSDAALEQVIALGGSALGKSAMMPPYGSTLSKKDIHDLIQYLRKLASSNTAQASTNMQASTGRSAQ
jgi:mono/diheme cytochrome c family protein